MKFPLVLATLALLAFAATPDYISRVHTLYGDLHQLYSAANNLDLFRCYQLKSQQSSWCHQANFFPPAHEPLITDKLGKNVWPVYAADAAANLIADWRLRRDKNNRDLTLRIFYHQNRDEANQRYHSALESLIDPMKQMAMGDVFEACNAMNVAWRATRPFISFLKQDANSTLDMPGSFVTYDHVSAHSEVVFLQAAAQLLKHYLEFHPIAYPRCAPTGEYPRCPLPHMFAHLPKVPVPSAAPQGARPHWLLSYF